MSFTIHPDDGSTGTLAVLLAPALPGRLDA